MKKILFMMILTILTLTTISLGNIVSAKEEYWPGESWRTSTPEEQGMDSEKLAKMIRYISDSQKGIDSVTIIRNGYVVTDAYFYPFQKGMKHNLYTATNSVTGALVGIALDEGYIKSITNKVTKFFPDLKLSNVDEAKKKLTVQNLLTMSTGLDWNVLSPNEMVQSKDWTKYVLDLPMKDQPGLYFNYCDGTSQVLSSILQRTTKRSSFQFAQEKLFEPLGIKDAFWGTNPENITVGFSDLYMQPADIAKFGYLYLKSGNWNGKQVVPEEWVSESTQKQIGYNMVDQNAAVYDYGYQWWTFNDGRGYAAGMFGGQFIDSETGIGGQYIIVIPESELVIVFTSSMANRDWPFPADLTQYFIIPAISSNSPLNPNPDGVSSLNEALKNISQVPTAKTADPMPEIASKIAGKTFVMDDSSSISFMFKGGNEASLTWTINNVKHEMPIGLDDVFRKVDLGKWGKLPDHNQAALKGLWLDGQTFQVILRRLEDGEMFTYRFEFEGTKIQVYINSRVSGYVGKLEGEIKE